MGDIMLDIYSPHFGKDVKKVLIELGMNQSELSRQMNVSSQYVRDILKGSRNAFEQRKRMVTLLESMSKK